MDLQSLTEFFKWTTIVAGGIYIWSALFVVLLRDLMVGIQTKMFNISEEAAKLVLYGYLAIFKILFIIFVFSPFIALLIIG